jgi:hypothetical protein
MGTWQRREILIWGKTRPELSKSYREIVCTGGVFKDTGTLVRLYPIPLRFMDDAKLFAKYQWIAADVKRNESDPRPESYKVRYDSIEVLGKVETKKGGDWSTRAATVLQPRNVFQSVEALQDRQKTDRTSLGIVKPAEIQKISSTFIGASEKAKLMERWSECARQGELTLEGEKTVDLEPLKAPAYWFRISFRCDDTRCEGHVFKVLDWEVDAYFNRRRVQRQENETVAAEEVKRHLERVCGPDRDTRFFIGNISSHPQVFTIVGLWYAKLKLQAQRELFSLQRLPPP